MMFHPQGPTFWELARQALSSTERGYDLLAPKFNYTPFRTPQPILDAAASLLAKGPEVDTALDICCGTGAATSVLRGVSRQRVVGIDFSRNMLKVAQQQTSRAAGEAAVEFVRGDVLNMPFDGAFDLAVCFGALGHIVPRDQPRLAAQIARVLVPGGRFVFGSAHPPSLLSRAYWLSRGFNAAMHLRNLLIRPPFVMYYLKFLIPRARQVLEAEGFTVEVHDDLVPPPYERSCLVVATREGGAC